MGCDHQGQRRQPGLMGFNSPTIQRQNRGRTAVRYLIELSVACAMLTLPATPASAQQSPFRFQEATIAGIHAAFAAGQLTCTQLTNLYLDRIAAYNMQGPSLHAIITVNPKAMDIAAEMDRGYRTSPASGGPLPCLPGIPQDNFNTFHPPTDARQRSLKNTRASPPALP